MGILFPSLMPVRVLENVCLTVTGGAARQGTRATRLPTTCSAPEDVDARHISAFTRVFDALWPGMTWRGFEVALTAGFPPPSGRWRAGSGRPRSRASAGSPRRLG